MPSDWSDPFGPAHDPGQKPPEAPPQKPIASFCGPARPVTLRVKDATNSVLSLAQRVKSDEARTGATHVARGSAIVWKGALGGNPGTGINCLGVPVSYGISFDKNSRDAYASRLYNAKSGLDNGFINREVLAALLA